MKKQMLPIAVEVEKGQIVLTQDTANDDGEWTYERIAISPEQADIVRLWIDEAAMEIDARRNEQQKVEQGDAFPQEDESGF